MKYEFTNQELVNLDEIKNDLIVSLFDTSDKRFMILYALKKAYLMGREARTELA